MKTILILAVSGLALAGCQTTEQRNRQVMGQIVLQAVSAQAVVRACPDEVRLRNRPAHAKIMSAINKSNSGADFRNIGKFTQSTLEVGDRCDKLGERMRMGMNKNIFLEAR